MCKIQSKNINDIDVGLMVRTYLNEHGIKISWLAEQIHTDRSNCYRMLNRKNMDVVLLARISQCVGFNFIEELSKKI